MMAEAIVGVMEKTSKVEAMDVATMSNGDGRRMRRICDCELLKFKD